MRTRLASHGDHSGTALLLRAGYVVAALLVLVPLADALARTWPLRLGDERWRFGTLGILLNAMVTPLLGTFLAAVIAAVLEQRRALRSLAALTLVGAALSLAAIPAFGLDYLQLRAGVTAEAMSGFDASARKAIVIGLVSGLATLVVGVAAWRAASRTRPSRTDTDVGLVLPQEGKA